MSARGSYYVGSCLISSRGKGGGCRPPGVSPRSPRKANSPEDGNGGEGRAEAYGPTSSHNRNDDRRSPPSARGYSDGGWAGGVPLISVTLPRGANIPPCSRLALRGAPLILSSRGKVEGGGRGGRGPSRAPEAPGGRRRACGGRVAPEKENLAVAYRASDSVSVASDEGSSSVNSESGLPRIIKPRKRRKKERRPAKGREDPPKPAPPPDPPAPEASAPRVADVGERTQEAEVVGVSVEASILEEADDPPVSLCHCRLCDPSGFIWGMDRSCYTPFLTPAPTQPPAYSVYRSGPVRPAHDSPSESAGGAEWAAEVARERWSAVAVKSSEEDVDKRWGGSGRNLEVSTEIITSPNGHRDLEIKFYSTVSSDVKGDDGEESVSRGCCWNAHPFDLTEE